MGLPGDATAIMDGGNGGSGGMGLPGDVRATAKLALATKMAVTKAKRTLAFITKISCSKHVQNQPKPKDVRGLQQKCHIFAFSSLFL